jgi:hypothetical protein
VDDPEGPTEAEAILVTGDFIGVAMAFLIHAQLSGTAAAAEQALLGSRGRPVPCP